MHYHRPEQLNGRVRNGNACGLLRMVTGNATAGLTELTHLRRTGSGISIGSGNNVPQILNSYTWCICTMLQSTSCTRQESNVVKHSSVSTGQLRQLLAVHRQPINLVVFQGTLGLAATKPNLGDGFVLICFQHLSKPYLATLRCHERDNRNTRGTSLQILSY